MVLVGSPVGVGQPKPLDLSLHNGHLRGQAILGTSCFERQPVQNFQALLVEEGGWTVRVRGIVSAEYHVDDTMGGAPAEQVGEQRCAMPFLHQVRAHQRQKDSVTFVSFVKLPDSASHCAIARSQEETEPARAGRERALELFRHRLFGVLCACEYCLQLLVQVRRPLPVLTVVPSSACADL